MKPIYEPRGKAKEYCDLAINIYTGCNHGCTYCYAPRVLHKTKEQFCVVEPRKGIVDALKRQLSTENIKDREIQLCFTCDPYPAGIDTTVTREIIEAIKNSGNHLRILTKAPFRASRDFDLLDSGDWFGTTIACDECQRRDLEPYADDINLRIVMIGQAHRLGIKTWVSFEPVYNVRTVYDCIRHNEEIDMLKIGKLNYAPSDIDWSAFGHECERLCQKFGRNYYIKEDLRNLMEPKI